MSVRIPDFYIFPQFGGPSLAAQYPNLRNSFGWLNAVMRNSYIDESTNLTTHVLNALAYGELPQRFKFRWRYDAATDEFQLQQNTTDNEATPTWTTIIKIRESDGRVTITGTGGLLVTGGFYNFGQLDVAVTELGGAAFGNVGTLLFDSNSGFYLHPDSSGRPIVSINVAAAAGTLTDLSNEGAGSQVYKTKVGSIAQLRTLVAGANVSITQNTDDLTINATDTGETNTASNLGSGAGVWFDKQGVDLRFKSLTAGTGITITPSASEIEITSTSSGSFYGILFKENQPGGYSSRGDELIFISSEFYLNPAADGGTVVGLAEPGVLFSESRVPGLSQRSTKLFVDSAAFYLQQLSGSGVPLLGLQPRIELNQLDMNGSIRLLEISEPVTPGTDRAVLWASDDHNHTVINLKDDDGHNIQISRDNVIIARNNTGSTIVAGSAVYISSSTGDAPNIALARADSATTSPAFGILPSDISDNGFGLVYTEGVITGLNLSAFNAGDSLWLSPTTAGTLTSTEPSHPNFSQQMGIVIRGAIAGILLVSADHLDGQDFGTQNATFTIGATTASSAILTPTSTSQQTVSFQDKSGTVAYLDDVGPGFYGILFRESEAGGARMRSDRLTFESDAFYLTGGGDRGPLLSLKKNLNLSELSFTEIPTPPTPPVGELKLWATEREANYTSLSFMDSSGRVLQAARDSIAVVRNSTGSTIAAGSTVYIVSANGSFANVALAQANSSSTLPALGVVPVSISNNAFGIVYRTGLIQPFDLSGFTDGQVLYVSPTVPGGLTATEPTHPNQSQRIAAVVNSGATGSLLVFVDHAGGTETGTNRATFTVGTSAATSVVITPNSTTQRTATFQDASGTVAYLSDVGPGFYGVTARETDGTPSFGRVDTFSFLRNHFYLERGTDPSEVIISLRENFPFLFRESEQGGYSKKTQGLVFDSNFFYLDDSTSGTVASLKDFEDMPNFAQAVERKNALINGNFDIWQRGTSFDQIDNFRYTADRWQVFYVGSTGVDGIDITRSTFVPSDSTLGTGVSRFSYQISVDTADTSIADNECYALCQPIEGNNFFRFGSGTKDAQMMTFSFWTRNSVPGTYCVFFRNALQDSARTYVADYQVNAADVWEKKIITLRADFGGSWVVNAGLSLAVGFVLAAGSSLRTLTPNTWHNSSAYASVNQSNAFMATAGNIVRFGRIQLELGSQATELEPRLIGEELNLCQRYYAKTFPQSTPPSNGAGTTGAVIGKGQITGGTNEPLVNWFMPNSMRGTPTITLFNTRAGGAPGQWQLGLTEDSANARVIVNSDTITVVDNTGIPLTGTANAFIQITAESEL